MPDTSINMISFIKTGLSLVLFIGIWFVFFALWKYYWWRYKLRHIKGPTPVPIIGNVRQFGKNNEDFFKVLTKWAEDYRSSGSFAMYMGWRPKILVYNVQDIETILRDTTIDLKAYQYYLLKSWLGDGLVMSKGQKWSFRRKLLTPSFHFSILERFFPTMNEHATFLSDKLCDLAGSPEVNICRLITLSSLDTAFETIMGVKLKSQTGQGKDYIQALEGLGEIFAERLQYPWYWNDNIFKWTPLGRQWTKYLNILHETTMKIIKDKKKELEAERRGDVIIDDISQVVRKRRRLAFLDLLIEAQRQNNDITDDGIQEEVDTFMFGSHDTVSSTVAFSFYLLASNPHIQEKVHDELDRVLGNDQDRTITMDDLQKLEYMNCVMKECQRVLTTVPFIGRTLESDKYLCGTILPEGTELLLGLYWLHRDPKYFPNPDKFDPDRFLLANCENRPTFAFLPFSAGHRNCIGQKFALLEQKSMMASVLRKVRFTTTQRIDELGLVPELVLRASKGIHLKIHLRD